MSRSKSKRMSISLLIKAHYIIKLRLRVRVSTVKIMRENFNYCN